MIPKVFRFAPSAPESLSLNSQSDCRERETGVNPGTMKSRITNFLLLAASVVTIGVALGADNDVAAPKWTGYKQGAVKWRTTDTDGVHVPHVIVDSAATASLPTGAATAAAQATGNASLATIASNTGSATNSYANITTATTTQVKASAGVLHTITINSLGTVASSITVYDSTTGTGTKIATIDSLSATGLGSKIYDVSFATGLTVVTTGTAAPDITLSFR
jgi:hypothetical protein